MTQPQVPTLPFEVGELIAGKYRVDRLLGAGGMGVVVAATHIDLDRPVAVKLIREELAQDPAIVERLMLEARAAAKIKSDHVGKVLDVGKLSTGVPYIVMEFLDGVDLCQLLEQQGALPIIAAVDAVLQACEALAEAHQANIVHRDLKPENLFVARYPDGSPNIKVLDFGISKQLGDPGRRALTNPSSALGSPSYMAPEQMQADEVDVRVDIWALGAILYELLSNRQAFGGSTLPEVCIKVIGQEPIPLSEHVAHIPDGLLSIVNRCLSKNRDLRFSSVAELVEHLAPFGSERAMQSRDRVRGLHAGNGQPMMRTVLQDRPGSAPTMAATTPGGGVEINVGQTEHWTPSQGQNSNRSAARWPVFLGLTAVVSVGMGLWVFSKNVVPDPNDMLAEPRETAAAVVAAAPHPTPPSAPEPAPSNSAEISGAPTAAPRAGPSVTPVLDSRKPATSAPRAKSHPRPAATTRTDAWDPDSFGGRR